MHIKKPPFLLEKSARKSSLLKFLFKKKEIWDLTYDSCNQTQDESRCDEDPVPVVFSVHCGHTQKDEDQRLTDAAPHFEKVLDSGVGLVGYISFYIGSHHCSTCY